MVLGRRTVLGVSRRRRDETGALLRLVPVVMVGGAVALLLPSLLAATVDGPSAVVLAAVAMAVVAVIRLNSYATTVLARASTPRPPTRDEALVLLAGRVTDPLHHPLRPRAPGRA